jgi:hypothetical protein
VSVGFALCIAFGDTGVLSHDTCDDILLSLIRSLNRAAGHVLLTRTVASGACERQPGKCSGSARTPRGVTKGSAKRIPEWGPANVRRQAAEGAFSRAVEQFAEQYVAGRPIDG